MNFITANIKTSAEQKKMDAAIDAETARIVRLAGNLEGFGIMTAAFIDGEFVVVFDYDLPEGAIERLRHLAA